jgi:DNA-binding MarR family transcriptional regulator
MTRNIDQARSASTQRVTAVLADFRNVMREVRCLAGERLVRAGVSMTHLHLLWMLDRHGDLTMSRLAELLDVSMSNATGLIDRMAERGLVERDRVADDRRVVIVRISERGREVLHEVDLIREDVIGSILGRLDDAQLERVADALEVVRDAAVAAVGRDGSLVPHAAHEHHRLAHV